MVRAAQVAALVLVLAASCKPAVTPEITGTLSFGATQVTELTCRPGAATHIFVDIVTPKGTLRFEDQKLSRDGELLTCSKLDRSWGGGRRPNNEAYWRGTLAFTCGDIVGDLALDCGHITPDERASLDAQRKTARDGASTQ